MFSFAITMALVADMALNLQHSLIVIYIKVIQSKIKCLNCLGYMAERYKHDNVYLYLLLVLNLVFRIHSFCSDMAMSEPPN